MCTDDDLSAVQPTEVKLPAPLNEVLQFASGFAAVMINRDGTVWVRRGAGDLLHVLGYYAEQHSSHDPIRQLTLMSDVLKYVADHLDAG